MSRQALGLRRKRAESQKTKEEVVAPPKKTDPGRPCAVVHRPCVASTMNHQTVQYNVTLPRKSAQLCSPMPIPIRIHIQCQHPLASCPYPCPRPCPSCSSSPYQWLNPCTCQSIPCLIACSCQFQRSTVDVSNVLRTMASQRHRSAARWPSLIEGYGYDL